MSVPAFAKNPKVIIGALVVIWLAYVIYANIRLSPVQLSIIPFLVTLQINVSALIVTSGVFGCIATLAVQWFWRRRRSKNGSASATAPAANTSTVA